MDAGETPRQAALRELKAEIGTDNAEIIAESRGWLYYDLGSITTCLRSSLVRRTLQSPAAKMVHDALQRRIAILILPVNIPSSTPGGGFRSGGQRACCFFSNASSAAGYRQGRRGWNGAGR